MIPRPEWLTQTEAAASAGVDARTFRAWSVEPAAVIGTRRYYTAAAVIENRIEAERQRRPRPANTAAELRRLVDDAEIELVRQQTARAELGNRERRRELVEVEALTDAIGAAAAAAGAVLDSLPGRIRRIVPRLSHSRTDQLRAAVAAAMNQIADGIEPEAPTDRQEQNDDD